MISLTTLTAISSFDRLAAESDPQHPHADAGKPRAPRPRRPRGASVVSTFTSVAILALSAIGGVALVLVAG